MKAKTQSVVLLLTFLTFFLSVSTIYANEHNKKHYRYISFQIENGKYDAAIEYFENYLGKYLRDLESLYDMAVKYSPKQNIDRSIIYVKQAVQENLFPDK